MLYVFFLFEIIRLHIASQLYKPGVEPSHFIKRDSNGVQHGPYRSLGRNSSVRGGGGGGGGVLDVRDNIFLLPAVTVWITNKYHLPLDLDLDLAGA